MTIPVLTQAKQRWRGNAAQLWIFFQGAMLFLACSMLVIVGPFIVCPPKSLGYDIWSSSYSYNWGSIVNLIFFSWILRLLVAEKWSSSPRIDQGFNQGMIQIRGTHRDVSLKACTDSTEMSGFCRASRPFFTFVYLFTAGWTWRWQGYKVWLWSGVFLGKRQNKNTRWKPFVSWDCHWDFKIIPLY